MTTRDGSAGGPQLLPRNQLEHFYRGGDRIAVLRGGSGASGGAHRPPGRGDYQPEEWIASVTPMAGQRERGLSRLADGTLLRDALRADPAGWLGPSHVDCYGASTELLVKLLDAGQRLPVHVHPDRAFAGRHLGLPHGKTEAWVVLDAADGAQVRLGFAEPVRLAQVREMMAAQDTGALVAALHARPVRPGDAVLVPAGLPHCLDAGIFVLELQEPTDLSILLEWAGFAVDGVRDGHLGLGFDIALRALSLDPLDQAELDRLMLPREQVEPAQLASLLPPAADAYFRVHRLRSPDQSAPDQSAPDQSAPDQSAPDQPAVDQPAPDQRAPDRRSAAADRAAADRWPESAARVAAGFSVVLVTGGTGRLVAESADRLALRRGDAAVVPWRAGQWWLEGPVEALVCRPPLPRYPGTAP